MRAAVYDRFGQVDVLTVRDVPRPVPAQGEVIVEMRAASLNAIDAKVRLGRMGPLVSKTFPKTPGADLAGVIDQVGPGVTGFTRGMAVFGATDAFKGGALAEFVAVKADHLAPKPDGMPFDAAACLPIAGLAALLSMRDLGQVGQGTPVLIHGASGPVGLFAVQIARALGARVTAVSGAGSMETLRGFGAERVIDRQSPDAKRFDDRFDVILNASGHMPYGQGSRFLTPGGRLIEPSPTIPVFIGSKIANLFRRRRHLVLQTVARTADLVTLGRMVTDATVIVQIAGRYRLDAVRDAYTVMESGGLGGKVVVTV